MRTRIRTAAAPAAAVPWDAAPRPIAVWLMAGAAALAASIVLPWGTVSFEAAGVAVDDTVVRGWHLPEAWLAVASAAAGAALCVIVLAGVRGHVARVTRDLTLGLALAAVVAAGLIALRAMDRLGDAGVAGAATRISQMTGLPAEILEDRLRMQAGNDQEARPGRGVALAAAAGLGLAVASTRLFGWPGGATLGRRESGGTRQTRRT